MRPITPFRLATTAITALALVAACGGDDGGSTPATSAPATTAAEAPEDDAPASEDDDATADDEAAPEPETGGYDPGDIGFRVVNLLDEPVDLYVRTTGLVEAFPVATSVGTGAITDLYFPPASGIFLITEAGAGDATCVSGCDHFIAELSTFPEEGPIRTVLLYTDEFDQRRSFDLWEQPDPSRTGNANAMVEPDPTTGLAVVIAVALRDADFGLRLSLEGTTGCAEPVNLENVLVGGNQTPAFDIGSGSASLVLHRNDDRECAEAPVGGPFTVATAAGARSIVILSGAPDDMEATIVPMVGADSPTPTAADESASGTGGSASSADVERAVALFAEGLAAELGLPADQARCASELVVDAVGADVLLDGDELTDLDSLPFEVEDAAIDALIVAVGVCGIDPALLAG